ncbi:MAG: hypothetical protein WCO35_02145 [Candidatus Nomurabacteria bacterium]
MTSILIILQSISFVTNIGWKFLFSKNKNNSKYWYIVFLDSIIVSLICLIQGLYSFAFYEFWIAMVSIFSKYIWENKSKKILDIISNSILFLVLIFLFYKFGLTIEYFAVLSFIISVYFLKNKNRLTWIFISIGQILMMIEFWKTGTFITFAALVISQYFVVKGFLNWKK